MKTLSKLVAVLGLFYFFAVASTKNIPYVCDNQIEAYLNRINTSGEYNIYLGNSHDTLLIRTTKDSAWDVKTAEICRILKDTCKVAGYKILVLDTAYYTQPQNTPYGHQIFIRDCR